MKKIFILTLLIAISSLPAMTKTPQNNTTDHTKYLNIEWWENFNDTNLTDNILTVYQNNYDIKNAALKIKENEKLVKMQFASELPFVGFSGDLNRDLRAPRKQFGSMKIPSYSQYNYLLPITMGYEVNIWGSNRLKTKSVKQQLEIIKQAQRATYISLTSDFAADYFNLIKADKLLDIQNELVKTQEQITSMTSDKYKIGLCGITQLLAEEKLLTSLKEEQNKHKLTKDVLEEILKVYLVNYEDEIKRNKYEQVTMLTDIPTEYDSSIVENRPDFKQEEANIRKIGFDVQVAKREFLPKFTIVGQIGLNAYHLGNLFNSPSQFFNAGILPSMDLFSGGRKLAYLKLKKYQYEEAANDFQKTILEGIKEVNTGVLVYKTAVENYNESKNRLNTQSKIYALAKDKNKIGASANLDVLYAKEAYLLTEKEEVSNKINSLISTISLYKSTGGVNLSKLNNTI
ncbi:MAG: TolC family protein [Muribaculaceae bacterium]|nr:TolC family protein [Muribaculaceae bacterium]